MTSLGTKRITFSGRLALVGMTALNTSQQFSHVDTFGKTEEHLPIYSLNEQSNTEPSLSLGHGFVGSL